MSDLRSPAGAELGRDLDARDAIEDFVRAFYRGVAMDDLLGPIFAGAHVDWPEHITKLTNFWAWQLLGQRGYVGNPLRAHEPLHARTPFTDEHYRRWLDLFDETLDLGFAGPVAEVARERARRMAHAMQRLLDGETSPADAITPMWADRS